MAELNFRTDRVGLLVDQLRSAREYAEDRLKDLTDEEYFWEPVPDCWTLRSRSDTDLPLGWENRRPDERYVYGPGEWVLDYGRDQQPGPFRTIAWLLSHLSWGYAVRWEWSFGACEKTEDVFEFRPAATEAVERFWPLLDRWVDSIEGRKSFTSEVAATARRRAASGRRLPTTKPLFEVAPVDDSENEDGAVVVEHVIHDPVIAHAKPVERVRGSADGLYSLAGDPAGL